MISEELFDFLKDLKSLLEDPSTENQVTAVNSGLFVSQLLGTYKTPDNLGHDGMLKATKELVHGLQKRAPEAWARFLRFLSGKSESAFHEFKAISPFADKLLIIIDYGRGFIKNADAGVDMVRFLDSCVLKKGWMTYSCDSYVLVLDNLESFELFWVDCGRYGVNGPRQDSPAKNKKKNK